MDLLPGRGYDARMSHEHHADLHSIDRKLDRLTDLVRRDRTLDAQEHHQEMHKLSGIGRRLKILAGGGEASVELANELNEIADSLNAIQAPPNTNPEPEGQSNADPE